MLAIELLFNLFWFSLSHKRTHRRLTNQKVQLCCGDVLIKAVGVGALTHRLWLTDPYSLED